MSATGKRPLPLLEGTTQKKKGATAASTSKAESKEKGESAAAAAATATPMMTVAEMEMEQECKKFIGGDYLRGFIPMKGDVSDYANDDDPDRIPDGAMEKHRFDFADIWRRYDGQLQTTNGMDLDTFPGCSMLVDAYPLRMSDASTEEEARIIYELIDLALEIYNHDESNLFKYKFRKVEKVNTRLTGYAEFFITVKFLNVTLATVVETFQIYAGQSMCRRHFKRVFSCVPKAGALT